MAENRLSTQIGRRISLPGQFDVPMILEDVRTLRAAGEGSNLQFCLFVATDSGDGQPIGWS